MSGTVKLGVRAHPNERHGDIAPVFDEDEAQVKTGADGPMSRKDTFQGMIIQFRSVRIAAKGLYRLLHRCLLMRLQSVKLFDESSVEADFHTHPAALLR